MGRKIKACDFCNGEYESEYLEGRNGFCVWLEVYPFNNLLTFMAQANDEDGDLIERGMDVQMNFCPVCGRRLIE